MKQTRTWCDRCKKEFEWEDRGYEVIYNKDGINIVVSIGDHPTKYSEICNNCFKDIVATGDIVGVSNPAQHKRFPNR